MIFQNNKTVHLWLFTICFSMALCAQKKKPNIIYIMADDHAANAIGAYKSRLSALNITPNLDKLAN